MGRTKKSLHPKTRNISNKNLQEIYDFIENFKPKNKLEERNLIILKYAYIDNLSARSIYFLKDPRLVSFSNHNNGNPMDEHSISRVIRSYNLEYEKKVDYSKRNNFQRRNEVLKKNYQIKRLKICSACGSKEKLELHHVIPIKIGGIDEYYNLIYLCHDCHMKMHKLINKVFEIKQKGGI